MKFTRRNFIQLLVGGVAGIHITPLPWKLTDDIAIWTQNWPWVPVPPVGPFDHVTSVCNLCPGGCGIQVRKAADRAVKIEGRTDYPVNPGGICPLGMGGLQLLYNRDCRFTGPVKRVGPRGSGQFVAITWEEALTLLSQRLQRLRRQGVPEQAAAVDGNRSGSTMALMIQRLLQAVGSPNYLTIPDLEETCRTAGALMMGTAGPMGYDLENADYVLSFGAGLIEGWGAPGRMINAWRLWHEPPLKGKVKIVQAESRASTTASKADQWVAVKPGGESALALAMAHVIIKERLYHKAFVDQHCFGFGDWYSVDGKHHSGFKGMVLDRYAPGRVSDVTGVAPEAVASLAREFAQAKRPLAVYGRGKGLLNGSLYECMAVLSLNALVGNINQPGGVFAHDPLPLSELPEVALDGTARKGLMTSRIDGADTTRYPFTDSVIDNLSRVINQSGESPVDTLMVFGANPAYTLPDGGAFNQALRKVPFVVSFSPYRDETAYMADLILPDHTNLEKTGEVLWPAGLQYPFYGMTKPVVAPLYDTRNTGDVILQLARTLGDPVAPAFPWKTYDDVLRLRAKGLYEADPGRVTYDGDTPPWEQIRAGDRVRPDYDSFDEMWRKLSSGGFWYRPAHRLGWRNTFRTPTGKFEFFSTRLERAFYDHARSRSSAQARRDMGLRAEGDQIFMPHDEGTANEAKEYPLVMVPYEMIYLSTGWLPSPPFHKKTITPRQLLEDDSFAEINPRTASDYGLKQDDPVDLETPGGKLRVRVNLFEGAMPGVVYLPMGFGHWAYDEFLRGKGANPNRAVHSGIDALSGHPVWWHTPARIIKV